MSASIGFTRPEFVAGRILPEISPQLASRSTLVGGGAFIGHGQNDKQQQDFLAWFGRLVG
ncbi:MULTISPECIES: hypothetical protein [Pseudomonas]|uniref:Uncharacterized protein n=1 Tax=Pseudomonas gessardii TaxID=78544 RepID=A0A7Y1QPW7_9PSED|nr:MULTISPECIES: hypothetical protein [Pseudomonas]MCF5509056.1 hypothetical protein [Pseudomonas sp. PA-3-6H]MCF5516774.1 hypothetical protein [Pseudomonas sp. PA-3-6E]MCF5564222.1 hypothetical protein [Pseudomonas sp. PA-3-5D]MCF5568845.1 hypothetical protein [Pseudomonas sp. PA-3-11C]MCF5595076.1 hypothetical protein [Pseudomonas sp. PA-3-10C]